MVIRGGAGPAEAAAVAAAITYLLELEAERSAHPEDRPRLPAWVQAARDRPIGGPRQPLTQHARWSVEDPRLR